MRVLIIRRRHHSGSLFSNRRDLPNFGVNALARDDLACLILKMRQTVRRSFIAKLNGTDALNIQPAGSC